MVQRNIDMIIHNDVPDLEYVSISPTYFCSNENVVMNERSCF